MKTLYTALPVVNRAKWMLIGLALTVALLCPHQDATAAGQEPVALGSASSFAVLAGTTLTNTNPTTIEGDVGAQGAITNIQSEIVSGTYTRTILSQALLDLVAAISDATRRASAISHLPVITTQPWFWRLSYGCRTKAQRLARRR